MQGKVKWFSKEKGYGFIEVPGGRDVFVHARQVEGAIYGQAALTEGQTVEFEVGEGRKGPEARNVRVQKI